jgi:Tfp pilus assembly protein PilX
MSDARQAIDAARVAGAPERAPADFEAAQAAISRAETHLQAQEYTRARIAALEAKRHAAVALGVAEKAGPPPAPPPQPAAAVN